MVEDKELTLKERIISLKESGTSRDDIQRILGCSSSTVSKYLMVVENASDKAKEIIELINNGYSCTDIVKLTGYSKTTVCKWSVFANPPKVIERPEPKNLQSRDNRVKSTQLSRVEKMSVLRPWLDSLKVRCIVCGYNKCKKALAFHHVDESQKKFHLSRPNLQSLSAIVSEVNKCIVICNNCHAEFHDGLISPVFELNSIDAPNEVRAIYDRKLKPILLDGEMIEIEKKWLELKAKPRVLKDRIDCEIDFSDLKVIGISKLVASDILDNYHYLGATKKGYIKLYGLVCNKGIIGVAVITNCVRQGSIDTCELSRFVLTVNKPNLASKFLSLIITDLKKLKYKHLQSFAQEDVHSGGIYKAVGFKRVGEVHKTYNYNGIHKKTIYERAMALGLTEPQYCELFGLVKTNESGKLKFVLDLIL